MRDRAAEKRRAWDNFPQLRRSPRLIKFWRTGCSMRYPNVMQRPVWITGIEPARPLPAPRGSVFRSVMARKRTDRVGRRAQVKGADGTKIACLFLQAQPLLFSQNRFGDARSRHRVKGFSEVIGAVRGYGMKRRTARQLVRLLSDIRHAAHCSTLRASATNREMALASAERGAGPDESHENDQDTDTTREVRDNKPVRSGS